MQRARQQRQRLQRLPQVMAGGGEESAFGGIGAICSLLRLAQFQFGDQMGADVTDGSRHQGAFAIVQRA